MTQATNRRRALRAMYYMDCAVNLDNLDNLDMYLVNQS